MALLKARTPFLGMNQSVDPGDLGPTEAQDALNVFLTYGTLWKRPGIKVSSPTGFVFPDSPKILGIYDYLKVDTSPPGGTTPIGMVKIGPTDAADATIYKIESGTATDLAVGALHTTNPMSFITANNRVYFCDGEVFKVWDGGASAYSAAAARPASAPTYGSDTSGLLSGTYDYKITWYAPDWGQETPASDASAAHTVVMKTINLTGLPQAAAAPDARFTKKRVYRRRVSANETVWTFVKEIDDDDATAADNVLDSDVQASLDIAPPSFDSTTLPAFEFMAVQQDVVFASGASTAPTALYYSLVGQPWALYQYLEVGSGADTDAVTGLVPFAGALVVFKERSIWILTGNSMDTFDLKKVVPGVGCRSHFSIVEAGNLLMFLSEDGFFAFDGANAWPLAGATTQDPVRDYVRARNYARDKLCVGGWDPDYGAVLWSFSDSGSAQNDKMIAFFPEHSKRVQYPSFVPQDMGGVSAMGYLTNPDTRDRFLHIGRNDGVLGFLEGDADNGEPIQFRWHTGDFDGEDPFRYKIWKEFQAEVEPEVTGDTLAVTYHLDGAGTSTALVSHDTTAATSRARVSQSSKSISLEFEMNSEGPLELRGWVLEYEKAGNV